MVGNSFTFSFNSILTMKNKYICFIVSCVLFIFLVFVFDQVVGRTLRHFYFRSEYGAIYHLTYSLDSTEADVVILGSSRAHNHYIPKIIEDSLGLTCFNTGMDGSYILNSYAVLKSLVERYTPRLILMDIGLGELLFGSGGYDELSFLLPYYKNKPLIRDVILLKSKFEKLKLMSEVYPFNSMLLAIAEGNIRNEDIKKLKGYRPLYGSLKDTSISYNQERDFKLDATKLKVLEEIASKCNSHNIRLVFIQSPRYARVDQNTIESIINELSEKHNAEFWNYVNDSIFFKPEYFKDGAHMNNSGASEFTKMIAGKIKCFPI